MSDWVPHTFWPFATSISGASFLNLLQNSGLLQVCMTSGVRVLPYDPAQFRVGSEFEFKVFFLIDRPFTREPIKSSLPYYLSLAGGD